MSDVRNTAEEYAPTVPIVAMQTNVATDQRGVTIVEEQVVVADEVGVSLVEDHVVATEEVGVALVAN